MAGDWADPDITHDEMRAGRCDIATSAEPAAPELTRH
jgi:hypothetical protein